MGRNQKHRTSGRASRNRPPFETVLVATDFTRGADCAVQRAARLPIAADGKLLVVHVLPDGIPAKYRRQAEREAREALDKIVRRIVRAFRRAGNARISVVPALRVGKPYVEIIRLARSEMADIVVVGRHGRRVLRDLLLGSTAENVIRKANIPVLVANLTPSGSYDRPLIALDLDDTARSIITLALRSVGRDTSGVSVVHAYTVPFEGLFMPRLSPRELSNYRSECRNEALSGLHRVLEWAGDAVRWRALVRRGDPRHVILREISARRADLVVLGTHGRSGVSHALLGSVAEHVVRRAVCDVLVTPPARVSFALP